MVTTCGADIEIAVITTLAAAGRVGEPEGTAALIHFLAADDCSYINGQALVADGGVVALYSNAIFDDNRGGEVEALSGRQACSR